MLASLFRSWKHRGRPGVAPVVATAETIATLLARGNTALQIDQLDEAERCYRLAIELAPGHADAHLNLGFVLSRQARGLEAVAALERAAALQPTSCDAHYLLGTLHVEQGALAMAIDRFERAIAAAPGFVLAHRDLGKLLSETGQNVRAEAVLRQALTLEPMSVELQLFLGNVLAADGQLDAAVASYEEAIRLSPEDANLHSNLALALANRGDDGAAIVSARRALALDPGLFHARSNLLLALSRYPDCSPAEYLAEARAYDVALAERGMTRPAWPAPGVADPARRLRIGFVSGDLRSHPVGFFLEGVMAHWDNDSMEAVAYSNHPSQDALTLRLRERFVAWRDISKMTDDAAERLIRADRIDVLIDLSGHTSGNRLPLFALRPAPRQISWLGYWASTGLLAIDHLLCDPVSIVGGGATHFSEALWYLPDTRLCFSPPAEAEGLEVSASPVLASGRITFGSFQGLPKLTDGVLQLWAQVLHAVPESKIRLQVTQLKTVAVRERLLDRLLLLGIDADRISLAEAGPRRAYLAAHAEVDIVLDTFPHGGATTTCEALWMGVPTITLAGDTLLSRQGASLLISAGLGDWVAATESEYVALAVRHAGALSILSALRRRLRERVAASPAFDGQRFASNLQEAIRAMRSDAASARVSSNALLSCTPC